MFQGLSETGGSCQGKDNVEMCTSLIILDSSHFCRHRRSRHHNQQSQALLYSTKMAFS